MRLEMNPTWIWIIPTYLAIKFISQILEVILYKPWMSMALSLDTVPWVFLIRTSHCISTTAWNCNCENIFYDGYTSWLSFTSTYYFYCLLKFAHDIPKTNIIVDWDWNFQETGGYLQTLAEFPNGSKCWNVLCSQEIDSITIIKTPILKHLTFTDWSINANLHHNVLFSPECSKKTIDSSLPRCPRGNKWSKEKNCLKYVWKA